jgi:hypothetical protein
MVVAAGSAFTLYAGQAPSMDKRRLFAARAASPRCRIADTTLNADDARLRLAETILIAGTG